MCKENKYLEFKLDMTRTYLKTVSAFANFGDGEIIFGISDEGKIVGIENPLDFSLDLENQINNLIEPQPEYSIKINPDYTVSLSVKRGSRTPYKYQNKAYKRNNTSTIEVDSFEFNNLVLFGQNLTFEEIESKNQNLTFNAFEKQCQNVLKISSLSDDNLISLGLIDSSGKYNNAALVFSDQNNLGGLDIVVYGKDINEIKTRIDAHRLNAIDQLDKALEIFDNNFIYEQIGGTTRKVIEKIPRIAFKEAVANAIVHREYGLKTNTKISMFSDYIEISSVGGLPTGLTEEQFYNDLASSRRNQIIANIFMRFKIIEAFGTGIRRIKYSYQNSGVQPDFKVFDNAVVVSLPVLGLSVLTPEEKEFINKLSRNIYYSRKDLEEILNKSKSTAIRLINILIDKKIFQVSGEGKAKLYKLI